ncbi:MAG: hypothetical protein HY884_05375 [Deltaproteobacteria bacterium]|nr:hypothetical protein [Deltaproteobacteria bacterium]
MTINVSKEEIMSEPVFILKNVYTDVTVRLSPEETRSLLKRVMAYPMSSMGDLLKGTRIKIADAFLQMEVSHEKN